MKLSEINKELRKEMLPEIKRQQAAYLMNKTPARCKEPLVKDLHYTEIKNAQKCTYSYTDEGVKFLRSWSIARRFKERAQ